jgi:hypothetical protein
VPIRLPDGEPAFDTWRVIPLREFVRLLLDKAAAAVGRPLIVAIDGRSGNGKTTVAARLEAAFPGAATVHTDDVAWWHSRFGWEDLMIGGILEPLHQGDPVSYRPPAWLERSRGGSIVVPASASMVIIEGVGSGRRELAPLTDVMVWVQSDAVEAERRGIGRDGGDEDAVRRWNEWMAEERPFLARDRPWERAAIVVSGTPAVAHDPVTEVVIAGSSGVGPA